MCCTSSASTLAPKQARFRILDTRSQPQHDVCADQSVDGVGRARNDAADEAARRHADQDPSPAKLVRDAAKQDDGDGASDGPDDRKEARIVTGSCFARVSFFRRLRNSIHRIPMSLLMTVMTAAAGENPQ